MNAVDPVPDLDEPQPTSPSAGRGFALVLGGGGAVGIAYHVGVLRALEEVGGLDVRSAEVIIGTSAGAVVGACLRVGHTYEEILALAGGDDAEAEGLDKVLPQAIMAPVWQSRAELYRSVAGATWSISRALLRVPLPQPPGFVQRLFPAALFSLGDAVWAAAGIPDEWPEREVWMVTADLDTGRRVVLRRPSAQHHTATLRHGVAASTAVPGLYHPVRVGNRRLVDGGVHSSTNLDLGARTGCPVVIGAAPMGFDPVRPPGLASVLVRSRFNAHLDGEQAVLRRAGCEVLLIRPSGEELHHHGVNLLRMAGNDAVMQAAYQATAVLLSSSHAHRLLDLARASTDGAATAAPSSRAVLQG